MASLYNILTKKDSEKYKKLAKELHRKGTVNVNGYVIEPHPKALEMYNVRPTDSKYKSMRMAEADWILLATTRSKESLNSKFVYNGCEEGNMDMLKAVNWPRMMKRMTKQLVGGTNIKSTGLFEIQIEQAKRPVIAEQLDKYFDTDLYHLRNIEQKHKQGKHIMMMIDAQMIEGITSYSYRDIAYQSHWVVYEGGLTFYDKDDAVVTKIDEAEKVGFKIFTWGKDLNNDYKDENDDLPNISDRLLIDKKVTVKSFKSTFYGYIETN